MLQIRPKILQPKLTPVFLLLVNLEYLDNSLLISMLNLNLDMVNLNQAMDNLNQDMANHNQATDSLNQVTDSLNLATVSLNLATVSLNLATDSLSPATVSLSPVTVSLSPVTVSLSPVTVSLSQDMGNHNLATANQEDMHLNNPIIHLSTKDRVTTLRATLNLATLLFPMAKPSLKDMASKPTDNPRLKDSHSRSSVTAMLGTKCSG
jgi:hypothetical protein